MSEAVQTALPPQAVTESLISIFGLQGQDAMPSDLVAGLLEITQVLSKEGVDAETASGIIKSFELKAGQAEDSKQRVGKFLNFLRQCSGKTGLLDTVKSLGFYSKAELEEYAKDTGDWTPFLKRVSKESKK